MPVAYLTPLTVLFGARPQYKHYSVHNSKSTFSLSLFSSSISHPLYSVACWRCLQLTPRRCFSSSILRLSRDFSLIFFPSSILSLLCTSYIVTIFPFFSLHAKPVFCDYCLKVLLTPVGQKQKNPQKKGNRKKKKRAPKKKAFTHAYLLLPTPTHTHKKIITTRSDFPLYHHHFLFSSPPPLSSVTRCCCVLFARFLSTLHLPQVVLS